MPIYKVTNSHGHARLVRGPNKFQAIGHCARGEFSAAVATPVGGGVGVGIPSPNPGTQPEDAREWTPAERAWKAHQDAVARGTTPAQQADKINRGTAEDRKRKLPGVGIVAPVGNRVGIGPTATNGDPNGPR